jgi:hypothetical protein
MSSDESHKSFRPFTTLIFRQQFHCFQYDPKGYHIVNIVSHGVVSAMIFCFVHMLSGAQLGLSLTSALLFAFHPVHVESIANIAHFAEMLCATFYLLCLMAFMRACEGPRKTNMALLLVSALCFFLSCLAKEIGLTAIGVTTIWSAVFLVPGLKKRRLDMDAFAQFILRGVVLTVVLVAVLVSQPHCLLLLLLFLGVLVFVIYLWKMY